MLTEKLKVFDARLYRFRDVKDYREDKQRRFESAGKIARIPSP